MAFIEKVVEADYFYTNLAGEVIASFVVDEGEGEELVHAVIGPCVITKIA